MAATGACSKQLAAESRDFLAGLELIVCRVSTEASAETEDGARSGFPSLWQWFTNWNTVDSESSSLSWTIGRLLCLQTIIFLQKTWLISSAISFIIYLLIEFFTIVPKECFTTILIFQNINFIILPSKLQCFYFFQTHHP